MNTLSSDNKTERDVERKRAGLSFLIVNLGMPWTLQPIHQCCSSALEGNCHTGEVGEKYLFILLSARKACESHELPSSSSGFVSCTSFSFAPGAIKSWTSFNFVCVLHCRSQLSGSRMLFCVVACLFELKWLSVSVFLQ